MKAGILPALLVFTALLVLNALIYMPFLSDDALISMRYSNRLVNGQGLTWTEGEAVEGYSNLLWVLLTAGGMVLGVSGVLTVRLLGIFSIICFFFIVLFTYRKSLSKSYIIVLLFAVLSAPLGAWAVGGLEQPLVAALLALSIPLIWRIIDNRNVSVSVYLTSSIPLALLCLTRPDGAIFTGVAVFVLLLARRGKRSFLLAVLPALAVAGQLGFRLFFYGDYVPNTARIKMRPSLHYSIGGVKYLIRGLFVLFPFSLLSFWGTIKAFRKKHIRTLLPASMAIAWMMYLILIGGDIFPAYRHFVPLVILFSWICIEEFPKVRVTRLTVSVLSVTLILFVLLQYFDSRNRAARLELWEWDGQVIALTLKDAFTEQKPVLAVTAAGSLPYWSELPSIDMLGLNDRYLAMNQGSSAETGFVGHNVCDPDYILERRPDIVSFNVAGQPSGLAIAESLYTSSEFQNSYSEIFVKGEFPYSYTGVLWFLLESTVIGIEKSDETIKVPAYFFNRYQHTVMTVQEGKPGITVSSDQQAGLLITGMPDAFCWESVEDFVNYSVEVTSFGDSLFVDLTTEETEYVFISEVILRRTH